MERENRHQNQAPKRQTQLIIMSSLWLRKAGERQIAFSGLHERTEKLHRSGIQPYKIFIIPPPVSSDCWRTQCRTHNKANLVEMQ